MGSGGVGGKERKEGSTYGAWEQRTSSAAMLKLSPSQSMEGNGMWGAVGWWGMVVLWRALHRSQPRSPPSPTQEGDYGMYRKWGAVGWGGMAFVAGAAIDVWGMQVSHLLRNL